MKLSFETGGNDGPPSLFRTRMVVQGPESPNRKRGGEVLAADMNLVALPAIANLVKRRLKHVEADHFNRNKSQCLFQNAGRGARIVCHERVDELVSVTP